MKILVVTGASKGIGKAIANQFIACGYRVINLSRTLAQVNGIENHTVDLASPELRHSLEDFFDKNIAEKTEICLVHNAALLKTDRAHETAEADFQQVLDINLIAPHILNQLLIPRMIARSSIIYIGSTLAEKAVPNSYTYVVTKHAQIGMMKATCQDLAGSGIHTACVCPGFTNTEMLRAHLGNDPEILKSIASLSTFGRLIEPEEIASTVAFAADNPVMNGSVIHANLGQVES